MSDADLEACFLSVDGATCSNPCRAAVAKVRRPCYRRRRQGALPLPPACPLLLHHPLSSRCNFPVQAGAECLLSLVDLSAVGVTDPQDLQAIEALRATLKKC